MPLDLADHPARCVPTLGLLLEAVVAHDWLLRRSADGPRQQMTHVFSQQVVFRQADHTESLVHLNNVDTDWPIRMSVGTGFFSEHLTRIGDHAR